MTYTQEMFENALKLLQDETKVFTPLCLRHDEKQKEACRYLDKRICLLCAIYEAKSKIWYRINAGKEKTGNTLNPFPTYEMGDYYFKHVGRDKNGFPKQTREQAVIMLTQMSRIFKDRGEKNEENSEEDHRG